MNYQKAGRIAGWVLHILIGGLIIFAGAGEVFGFAPAEVASGMEKLGVGDKMKLIATGEMISGLLLLIPVTSSLGVLLTSAFWGGVICIHMSHGESYVGPSVFLALTWLGALLRTPEMFSSFAGLVRADKTAKAYP
jgi:hypothetical protein